MNRSSKRNISHESTTDLLINLPSNIIECILSRLPIRDVVRTSILSRNWRHQWITLPQLVFDDNGTDGAFFACQPQDELVKIINGVLMQHHGSILKFNLSIKNMKSCSDIDRWINILSRKGIEEFVFKIGNGEYHKLPSYFFSCQNLRDVCLNNCSIKPPPTFTGFQKLSSLSIFGVTIMADVFESLVSNCPLLDLLFLLDMGGLDRLNIHAPNLKILIFGGNFKTVHIKYAPGLTTIGAYLTQLPDEKSSDLVDVIGSGIEMLILNSNFLKAETNSNADMKSVVEFMKAQNLSKWGLNKLVSVVIADISGVMPEMELIKVLLANSPALQTMTIALDKEHPFYNESRMSTELMSFAPASPNAQILYTDKRLESCTLFTNMQKFGV